MNNWAVPLLAG
ncbi:Protein of unknown function [Lactobacillus helveticus CIRM-BIA 953]|uniref:Uncharacterized protein n=1 Tax=Lactobacillus helveticus CIRM-BIA 953 TaxID=1226335 RepID=U4QEJ8_LACHE|nr:Protein of unknown function [Lactobacillus helveticus CIRM-BIA 953]